MRNDRIKKIQTRDICTALPRRVLVIIYFTTILPMEVCVENLKHVKVKWQRECHFLGKLKHSSYISFILFLLGRTPDYLKAHVHFISRFRRGLLGSTLLDELPERWHSVKRTLSVCKIETIAQLQHNFGMNKYLSTFKVFRPWHCILEYLQNLCLFSRQHQFTLKFCI